MSHSQLVGRTAEFQKIKACLNSGRNILLEGPVGVGKTRLALEVLKSEGRPYFRVDGDSRYTEQKLSGWFDPPTVIQKGFNEETFLAGPLVQAMRSGGVLFINELNRLPEGVQNILLPAIDEKCLQVPRLKTIQAAPGFVVVATQNPKEFVATSHLSEAILDRFELVVLEYQTEDEELQITQEALNRLNAAKSGRVTQKQCNDLARAATLLARATRTQTQVKRGASVRAAQSVAEITATLLSTDPMSAEAAVTGAEKNKFPQENPATALRNILTSGLTSAQLQSFGAEFCSAFCEAAQMALPTRVEFERTAHADRFKLIDLWAREALAQVASGGAPNPEVKKKS